MTRWGRHPPPPEQPQLQPWEALAISLLLALVALIGVGFLELVCK